MAFTWTRLTLTPIPTISLMIYLVTVCLPFSLRSRMQNSIQLQCPQPYWTCCWINRRTGHYQLGAVSSILFSTGSSPIYPEDLPGRDETVSWVLMSLTPFLLLSNYFAHSFPSWPMRDSPLKQGSRISRQFATCKYHSGYRTLGRVPVYLSSSGFRLASAVCGCLRGQPLAFGFQSPSISWAAFTRH